MPIRYTSPSLGGHRQVLLKGGDLEFSASYRRLTAGDWFIGHRLFPDSAPGGQPNHFNINTVDLSAEYGVSDRLSLRLTIPLSTGTNSRVHGDGLRHETSATGIGDVSLLGNFWLLDPLSHAAGNLALGLGIKAPTGSHSVEDELGTRSGAVIQFPVHPGLQLGDGGWGILAQAQGYRRLVGGLSGYFLGSYLLNPREKTEVLFVPSSPTSFVSVPDVYHGRLGLAYALWPQTGASASLGLRLDGIPVHDLLGGDLGMRNPGHTLYLDPGLAFTWGPSALTVSLPIRLDGKFVPNANDLAGLGTPSGNRGDLASYLIFFGYAYRFR